MLESRSVMKGLRLPLIYLIASAPLLSSGAARAQTQVRARPLVVFDTPRAMVEQVRPPTNMESNATDTGGDGSTSYVDGLMSRNTANDFGFALYQGFQSNNPLDCTPDGNETFRGTQSRMFNAKQALNNVLNGAGGIDWGLMR